MGETRVNLRHLLEDIREAYPFPEHEAILTELVANALDSGASSIRILTAFDPPRFQFADNGAGMTRSELERYHDVAATSKQRGHGIGFAGIGAKLSLLVCREVLTETCKGSFRGATRWWLESANTAPWREIPPPSVLPYATGTGVCLLLETLDSPLLDAALVRDLLREHFEPLFDPDLRRFLFLYYPGGVRFEVDGDELAAHGYERTEEACGDIGGRRGKPLGAAKLRVGPEPLPEHRRGVAVSVLGKVVKRGWEWLGLAPEHPELVTGVVEVPSLVGLLTTNKADFLRDASSLQRFYTIRKQIQQAIAGLLAELGELPGRRPQPRDLRPVEREVGQVLDRLLEGFPELAPLLERRREWETVTGLVADGGTEPGDLTAPVAPLQQTLPGLEPGEGDGAAPSPGAQREHEPAEGGEEQGKSASFRRRRPGLRLAWVDQPERGDEMSWLDGGVLAVNRAHPAHARARGPSAERLFLVTAIATALARHLGPGHDPLRFVSVVLARWGERAGGSSGGG